MLIAIDLSLPADLESFVAQKLAAGAYSSPSEVIGDALRLLRFHERERAAMIRELQEKVAVGLEQLDRGEAVEPAEVFAELRRRNVAFQNGRSS